MIHNAFKSPKHLKFSPKANAIQSRITNALKEKLFNEVLLIWIKDDLMDINRVIIVGLLNRFCLPFYRLVCFKHLIPLAFPFSLFIRLIIH